MSLKQKDCFGSSKSLTFLEIQNRPGIWSLLDLEKRPQLWRANIDQIIIYITFGAFYTLAQNSIC